MQTPPFDIIGMVYPISSRPSGAEESGYVSDKYMKSYL